MMIFNVLYLFDLSISDVGHSGCLEIADYKMVLCNLLHKSF